MTGFYRSSIIQKKVSNPKRIKIRSSGPYFLTKSRSIQKNRAQIVRCKWAQQIKETQDFDLDDGVKVNYEKVRKARMERALVFWQRYKRR